MQSEASRRIWWKDPFPSLGRALRSHPWCKHFSGAATHLGSPCSTAASVQPSMTTSSVAPVMTRPFLHQSQAHPQDAAPLGHPSLSQPGPAPCWPDRATYILLCRDSSSVQGRPGNPIPALKAEFRHGPAHTSQARSSGRHRLARTSLSMAPHPH